MATPASRSAMHRRRSTLAALGLLLTLAAPAMGQGAPAAAAAAAAASVGAAKAPSNATGNVTVAAAGVVTPMIIGGLAAPTNRLRHQVVLADNTSFAYCGGALVVTDGNPARNDAVLTAAHCTCATTDSAVAGANTRPDAFMGTVPTSGAPRVVRFLPHPQYVDSSATGNNQNQANDVALVFLSACVPPSAAVAPIRLATQQELDANNARTWIVSGVGTTSKNANVSTGMDGDTPSILQYGYVRYMDRNTCNAKPNIDGTADATMFCAYGIPSMNSYKNPPRVDTCQGDSGGSIIFNTGSSPVDSTDPIKSNPSNDRVAGVVSWGNGCGQADTPGVYTSVPIERDWIQWNIEAVPSACATTANITVMNVSDTRNFAWAPDAVVTTERSQAATFCAAECRRRALFDDGCVAYSVNWPPAGTVPASGLPSFKPRMASATVTLKTTPRKLTVDLAYCDIYKAAVPPRVCQPGETRLACAWPTMGSRRLRYT